MLFLHQLSLTMRFFSLEGVEGATNYYREAVVFFQPQLKCDVGSSIC